MGDALTPEAAVLHALLQDRLGPHCYGIYWSTGEGRYLPEWHGVQLEEQSGHVVSAAGEHYFWWLGWSRRHQRPTFTRWRAVTPGADWAESDEYQRALRRAGIPAP